MREAQHVYCNVGSAGSCSGMFRSTGSRSCEEASVVRGGEVSAESWDTAQMTVDEGRTKKGHSI